MGTPSTTGRSPADEVDRQLVEVGDRLCREFAGEEGRTARSIREQVHTARVDFGSPKVIDSLPVLVGRAVRHVLAPAPSTRHHDRTGRGWRT
jgi:hypothetical protein